MSSGTTELHTAIDMPVTSDMATLGQQKTKGYWSIIRWPLEALGQILRNQFYLPLYKKKIDHEFELDQREAKTVCDALIGSKLPASKKLQTIWNNFSVRDVEVPVNGPICKTFTVRLFESKGGDKKLRVILFSFYGNKEQAGNNPSTSRTWNPLSIEELSKGPLSVLQYFQSTMQVDSLVTTSLGDVALDGLKYFPRGLTVPTLIINRGLTSVKKVASQYLFPFNYLLYGAAKLCRLNADPEKELMDSLTQNPFLRRLVIIEAIKDFYFSGVGAFDADMHEKISQLGVKVFRAKFWPHPFHSRAHHALSLSHLKNNSTIQIVAQTPAFTLKPGEKMSSAIARDVFLEGNAGWHTCLCFGGSKETLAIGTVQGVLPLLFEFIKKKDLGERI